MSRQQRIRLYIEILVAGAIFAAGSFVVRMSHGQIVNDRARAAANTAWLQQQADKGDVKLPDGTLYINKRITLPKTIGARITSKVPRGQGYWYPGTVPMSAKTARIKQLTPGEPIFVLRGSGVEMDSVTLEGTGDQALIEVEGRFEQPVTGHHHFRNLLFFNAQAWFKALGGYYGPDGKIVPDENHAEWCTVTDCEGYNCERIFWSQNQQAVGWHFRGVLAGWDGNQTPPRPVTLFDIERGGQTHVEGLQICCPQTTVFRVRDYSPNTCWLTCRNLAMDRLVTPGAYLTLFAYAGTPETANWKHWAFECGGFVAQSLPADKLYGVPADMPRDKWNVNLQTSYKEQ